MTFVAKAGRSARSERDYRRRHRRTKERREALEGQILGLRMRGMSDLEIGQLVSLHPQQVEEIRVGLERRARDLAVVPDPFMVIGQKLQRLRRLQEQILGEADGETGLAKNALLNTALRCEEIETRLMQDAALLPKAADKLEHQYFMTEDGVDLRKVGADELRRTLVSEQAKLLEMVGVGGAARSPAPASALPAPSAAGSAPDAPAAPTPTA